MDIKKESLSYPQYISILILSALFFLLPLAISNITTDFFAIPKQAVLATGALLSLLSLSIRMIVDRKVRIRRTPFDLGLGLFTLALLVSAIFAVNSADAFTYFTIALFAVIIYFTTVNSAKDKGSILLLAASLILGATVSSLISILSFFKIYVFPYTSARIETFTPIGSLLDQLIYLSPLLGLALYIIWQLSNFREKIKIQEILKIFIFLTASIIILIGLIITIYQLMYKQRPTILPFETGFQTAFATISQDTGRTIKGFLFGSGFGTYSVDFSRFKQVSFNQNKDIWSLTFFRSSSFVLELIATTGILGFLSFIFICTKVINVAKSPKNPLLISVFLIFAAAFILPFSFITQTLLLILLALFAAYEGALGKKHTLFFDVDIQIVALRKGLLALESPMAKESRLRNRLLPVFIATLIFVFVSAIGYYSLQYVLSDLAFQKSIEAASQNNATLTYEQQVKAIKMFPYRDGYFRVHSQTALALADSLASQVKPGGSPDPETQKNIINLIQQSISSARNAIAISPLTASNWQNLSNIYRSLLGYGQNADQFAIASQQQAIVLNPNNPLPYLTLGGIYYQLGLWDQAQNQFQIATRLKPDLPNAYYNLGHALEEKGNVQAALEQYEIVKRLVANDRYAFAQITDEINALTAEQKEETSQKEGKMPLAIDQPSASLPAVTTPIKILPPATPAAKLKENLSEN